MIQKFATKRDVNGNRKTLEINHEEHTFKRGYNPFHPSDYIEITAKGRRAMIENLESDGYKETY